MLVCTIDHEPASLTLVAALAAQVASPGFEGSRPELGVHVDGVPATAIARLIKTCARRGIAAGFEAGKLTIAGRPIALERELSSAVDRARLRDGRVALRLDGAERLGERAELLAAAPLLEALDQGNGLRWAMVGAIQGSDGFASCVDLSEHKPDPTLEAGLHRCFPGMVGRVGFGSAVGPLLGAALHLSVLLGTGGTIDGVRDRLAAQAEAARSRWPRLRLRPGVGSADCLGDPGVHLDVDAIGSVGPLVRLVAYYDPPAVLAGDLLRRRGA